MSAAPSAAGEESQQGLQFIFAALLLLSFTLVLLFYLRREKADDESSRLRLAPGPPGLPVIGNLHQLIGGLPHRSLHLLSAAYGPLVRLQLGRVPALVVSSPALAREVLKTHDLAFCSRPDLTTWRRLSYGGLDLALAPYTPR
ncbi:cytochrome P450 71A1-like [Zingiber officinale]|uniref:cytochrome P450 71A1-like n=1 Tax=Zingiber officinale TaxID=94328 RepID=UPI001C4AD4CC|nr:cytochrome P450 71A1-like [Zingiber officinale]